MRPLHWILSLALVSSVAACKEKSREPSSDEPRPTETEKGRPAVAALPDEGPLPQLRTGTREPVAIAALNGSIVHRFDQSGQYFELVMDSPVGDPERVERVYVEDMPHALAFTQRRDDKLHLLIRRPEGDHATPDSIRGTVWLSGRREGIPTFFVASFSATGAAVDDPELPLRWVIGFSSFMRGDERDWWVRGTLHPWHAFAAGRVYAVLGGPSSRTTVDEFDTWRARRTELSSLMHTTTAATSLQEALQHDRGLRLPAISESPTIPIGELAPPGLEEHPFETMQAALPNPQGGVPEPAAQNVPAEFWYLRFDDLRMLIHLMEEAEAWMTPVVHVLEERAEVRDLAARYEQQLGLARSGLAKALGHTVVERVAIVGSDPYLREGTDVTFIFSVRNRTMFDAELARHLDTHRAAVGELQQHILEHHDHRITVHADAHRLVRQHRADVGELTIVSNSEAACRAVLDAIAGRRARLSDEPDLAYMLARDPGPHAAFAFLGDRFIAEVVGPRQKVLQARRQQALSELLVPGYAAILYGWLHGRPPTDTAELIRSGLLGSDELTHADGSPIAFTPGTAPTSRWGRSEALTPLIDLETPKRVTPSEQAAYEDFVRGYQTYWQRFIDPVAMRLDLERTAEGEELLLDVRVLPLISGTDYADIAETVGNERIVVPPIGDGVQAVWAVGRDSKLRRELDKMASLLSGKADIGLGWLGDWVVLGSLDRRALVDLFALVDDDLQMPSPRNDDHDRAMMVQIGKLPAYAMAHIRNPAAFVATLSAVRVFLNEVAPGSVSWGESERYRDLPIIRVGMNASAKGLFSDVADAIAVHYVQVDDVVVLALVPEVLHGIIDRLRSGEAPTRGKDEDSQFVVESRLAPGGAAWTSGLWLLQQQVVRTRTASRSAAEVILLADPSLASDPEGFRALSRAYLGSHPVTSANRTDFTLAPEGVRDPVDGSAVRPSYPELPIPGSPVAVLMARLARIRGEIAFDTEPAKLESPARSLHTRLRLLLAGQ